MATRWSAFQPEQCPATTTSGWIAARSSTVVGMIGSKSPPERPHGSAACAQRSSVPAAPLEEIFDLIGLLLRYPACGQADHYAPLLPRSVEPTLGGGYSSLVVSTMLSCRIIPR